MALRSMSADEFVRRVAEAADEADKRFAFLLGAGCSVTSEIPHAGSLVRDHWLPRLHSLRAPEWADHDAWIANEFPQYDPGQPAASYGLVMEQLFLQPEDRQREIERLCDRKFPGFGYAILAALMARPQGHFNVALTTNFDDLIADAMYLYTTARPLVIQHESLARFIRPTRSRPLVVKLHGDNRLAPQNTRQETEELQRDIETQVTSLLHDRGLIVLGYGGNDVGIAKMLAGLPNEALPVGVYWVSGSEPAGVVKDWLADRDAVWVRQRDFDRLMLLFQAALKISHPDEHRFETVFRKYTETYADLAKQVKALPEEEPDAAPLKAAALRGEEEATEWWAEALRAESAWRGGDLDGAERIFRDGIREFPAAAWLMHSYGLFQWLGRRNPAAAADTLGKSAATGGADPAIMGNYAHFLATQGRYDEAAPVWEQALVLDPLNASNVLRFVNFLDGRGDRRRADDLLASLGPLDALPVEALSDAGLLMIQRGDLALAERLLDAAAGGAAGGPVFMNRASLAYLQGDPVRAADEIAHAFEHADIYTRSDIEIEAQWLQAVHDAGQGGEEALSRLRELLATGQEATGFVFEPHLDRVPAADRDFAHALALAAHGRLPLGELERFPRWRDAASPRPASGRDGRSTA